MAERNWLSSSGERVFISFSIGRGGSTPSQGLMAISLNFKLLSGFMQKAKMVQDSSVAEFLGGSMEAIATDVLRF